MFICVEGKAGSELSICVQQNQRINCTKDTYTLMISPELSRGPWQDSAEAQLTGLFACSWCSFPKGARTWSHSVAGAINEGHASGPALLILEGHKDFGAQPKCLEQKVDIEAKYEIWTLFKNDFIWYVICKTAAIIILADYTRHAKSNVLNVLTFNR